MKKEDKQKLKRTKRHYCAQRNCLDCPIYGAYECCEYEREKARKESEENKKSEDTE